MTAPTLTLPTTTDYITATPRLCPTCATPMEQHGLDWVCPKQATEERRISAELRARGRALWRQRVPGCDF